MTLTELRGALWAGGVRLGHNGESLRVEAPVGALTDELQASLRQHKAALLALPVHELNAPVPVGSLTLAQFAGSGRVVAVFSDVLDCEVVFAADNAAVPEGEMRLVYRARELAAVWGADSSIRPDTLRLLHEVKTHFGGDVEAEEASEQAHG